MNHRFATLTITKTSLFLLLFTAQAASAQTLTGTATYLARIAMPADAVFEAMLLDVSRADAAAEELGRTRIESPGNPPIKFTITYDPARIQPNNTYSVRATIRSGGELMFTTDQAYPVLTRGGGTTVAMTLRLANRQPPPGSTPASVNGIENKYWRLSHLRGEAVKVARADREPHLRFEGGGRMVGADGCNSLRGLYELIGDTIRIGPLVGTLMACEAAKGLDNRFREAIGAAVGYKTTGNRLDLVDAKGVVVASFESIVNPGALAWFRFPFSTSPPS